MDAGIIAAVKRKYKALLLRRYVAALERDEIFKPNIIHVMEMLKTAWSQITSETIANCFRHAGFVKPV